MNEPETLPICRLLEWDTAFFGKRIARLMANTLSDDTAQLVDTWCVENRIDCLYFLAEANNPETIRLAETFGYSLVDVRITLGWQRNPQDQHAPQPANPEIRPAKDTDIEALKQIAGNIYTDTRFYFDRHFPRQACARLYETWVEQSCHGYAQVVLVVLHESQPAGYITCHEHPDHGQIGLLGISPHARKLGYGAALIRASLDWFADQGLEHINVVTQGRNIAAQRLYQQCGFLTEQCQLWYHRWFDTPPGSLK